MEDKVKKNNSSLNKKVETLIIKAEYMKDKISIYVSKEVIERRVEAIRRLTRQDDPFDAITIRAYLVKDHKEKEFCDILVEIKISKISEEEEVREPTNKKKALNNRYITSKKDQKAT